MVVGFKIEGEYLDLMAEVRTNYLAYTYLSKLMQINMKLERYKPNIRKNDMMRQSGSPNSHSTVQAHVISNGIIRNVT